MINKETNKVLIDLLKSNTSQNIIIPIKNLIGFQKKTSQLESEDVFTETKEMVSVFEVTAEGKSTKDYRIKEMSFRHFRSIPIAKDGVYGLRFTDHEGEPASVFLVGSNGAGKTTIYSAFERHYLSDTSLSKEKSLEEKKVLTFGFGQLTGIDSSVPTLTVRTMSNEVKEEHLDKQESYCSPAPFCSEYDLTQLGMHGGNLSDYILGQLGYGNLKQLRERLSELMEKKREDLSISTEYTKSDLKEGDLDDVIKQVLDVYKKAEDLLKASEKYTSIYHQDYALYKDNQFPKLFLDNWMRLRNLEEQSVAEAPAEVLASKMKSTTKLTTDDVEKQLQTMYALLEEALKTCANNKENGILNALTKLYNEKRNMSERYGRGLFGESFNKKTTEEIEVLQIIINQIKTKEREIVASFTQDRFDMIKEILAIFSNTEGDLYIPDRLPVDELRFEIKSSKKGANTYHATPQEYYNSFRYKLYAVSFKIALAFTEMKLKDIRVPIVIDDVFNASDFENNLRLEYFVYNIYKAYDSMSFDEPLQLIVLTHDEMVLNAFRNGANMMIEDKSGRGLMKDARQYQCGRLFSYRYAKKMAEELNPAIKDEKGVKFYNLYMQI